MDRERVPHNAADGPSVALPYNGRLLAQHKLWLKISGWLAFLRTLGPWGVLLLATIDSGAIPIPVDALVAGYVFANPRLAWLYVLAGSLGSALGSLVPYYLGRAGGELFLLKRINRERFERIRDRFERQEFLALLIPAMLPPPTPFKVFVFSAGVFEMRMLWFLASIAVGRIVRFGAVAGLTIAFGPGLASKVKILLHNHPSLAISIGVFALILIYIIFRLLRAPVQEVADEIKRESH